MRKRNWYEPFILLIIVAALVAWLDRPAPRTPRQAPVVPPPPPMDIPQVRMPIPTLSAYRVNGVYLGMSPVELQSVKNQAASAQVRMSADGQTVVYVKGDGFSHTGPKPPASDILLQKGTHRELVSQSLGKPVGFNDSQSKWGYWTRGLPDRKMGILITFSQDQVDTIEMASDWSELAAQLAQP